MDKLVVGCLVSVRGGRVGRVTAIEELPREGSYVSVLYCASRYHTSYYASSLMVIGPPLSVGKDLGPSLLERRDGLITKLENLKGQVKNCFDDTKLVSSLHNKLYYPEKYEWFWTTVAESVTDPKKVSFSTEIGYIDNDVKRKFCSYAKFLRGPAKRFGVHFEDEQIERLSFLIGSSFPDSRDYRFEIASGTDIVTAYKESPDTWNSCMTNSPQIYWYATNPEKVSIVKVYQGPLYCGRALLWTTDCGTKVLDRVYPSDTGPHTQALHAYAIEQGWDYKTRQSRDDGCLNSGRYDYIVTLHTKNRSWKAFRHGYPYLDTFKYTPYKPKVRTYVPLFVEKKRFVFSDTEGKVNFSGPWCKKCEEGIDPENICYNEKGEKYCRSCYNNKYSVLNYLYDGIIIGGEISRYKTRSCIVCHTRFLREHMEYYNKEYYCTKCPKFEVPEFVSDGVDQG